MRACLIAFVLCGAVSAATAQEPANNFRTRMMTAAFTPSNGPFLGDGNAAAAIDGRQIRIQGSFKQLAAPATRVRVLTGVDVGVPGEKTVAELRVSGSGTSGAFAGQIPASAANIALLRDNRLYIQVETQAAPDGALWGWLMLDHAFPGHNVPEKANPYAR